MVLTSDLTLTPEQMQLLRDRWNEQSPRAQFWRHAYFGHGMKAQPMAYSHRQPACRCDENDRSAHCAGVPGSAQMLALAVPLLRLDRRPDAVWLAVA